VTPKIHWSTIQVFEDGGRATQMLDDGAEKQQVVMDDP